MFRPRELRLGEGPFWPIPGCLSRDGTSLRTGTATDIGDYSSHMARTDHHLEHLAEVGLFSTCSKKELQKIARASDEVDIASGRTLVREGEIGREFFLILDGEAVVKRGSKQIATLGPGSFFGELSLLDRGPRSASVEAATDMTLLVLGQREFAGVLDEVPGMAHKLLSAMAARLREADERAVSH